MQSQDLKEPVRAALGRLDHWERRRQTNDEAPVQIGASVRYKDEGAVGVVTDLLDGRDGRKTLVGRVGAMVSFEGRAPVPVFARALQLAEAAGAR